MNQNTREYPLKTNGYQEVTEIFKREGYKITPKEQKEKWINKHSRYLDAKDCEIQLNGRCIAEVYSSKLEKDSLIPSDKWILVAYNGIEEIINKFEDYIEN